MLHECRQEQAILKIFNTMDDINKSIAGLAEKQSLTNQLLKGNGIKGLCERVADLEETVAGLNNLKLGFLTLGGLLVLVLDKFSSIISFVTHLMKG